MTPEEIRKEVLKTAAQALLAEAKAYDEKWCRVKRTPPNTSDWDRGFVRGMEAAAHSVANSIDRPATP